MPPTCAEFRETLELLDWRAKAFGKKSLDLIVALRRVAERGAGKPKLSLAALLLIAALAIVAGFWKMDAPNRTTAAMMGLCDFMMENESLPAFRGAVAGEELSE
ncbi:MAG: hypothetical protein ABI680_06405 [Chthoniobacteraceae bacterium]